MKRYGIASAILLVLAACGVREVPVAQNPTEVVSTEVAATVDAAPVQALTETPTPGRLLTETATVDAAPVAPTPTSLIANDAALEVSAPQGAERLLRDLVPAYESTRPTQFLYYIENPSLDSTENQLEARFWRVDLQSGERVVVATRPVSPPFDSIRGGKLSPDGQWIAYQRRTDDNSSDLYVMRVDGSEEVLIAQNVGTVGEKCESYFSWSPNSVQLAYNRYDRQSSEHGWRLEVVDVDQRNASRTLVNSPFLKFSGWTSNDTVLYVSGDIDRGIPYIEEIDVNTLNRRQIVSFKKDMLFYCITLSPDGSLALLNTGSGSSILNAQNGQLQLSAVFNSTLATWLPDSSGLLMLPALDLKQPFLSRNSQSDIAETVRLVPDTPAGTTDSWTALYASPDGRYLVACQTIRQDTNWGLRRQLLYSIATNTWSLIGTGCGSIMGWQ